MRSLFLSVVLGLLALAPSLLYAQTAGTCGVGTATRDLDIANVRARLYTTGNLFWNGAGNVYNVPKSLTGSTPNALFAAGLWVGGYVEGALRLAAASYSNFEWTPGPLGADGAAPANCQPYDRIYELTADDLRAYRTAGTLPDDLRDWPVGLGAPAFTDLNANGIYDAGTDPLVVPTSRTQVIDLNAGQLPLLSGDQMAWWILNDVGRAHAATGTSPLGLEAQVSAFASNAAGALGNMTFYRYRLVNRGARDAGGLPVPIVGAYASFWVDPDLGNATDDYPGTDSVLGLAYTYNADNFDEGTDGYGTPPPAIGVRLLKGPLVPDAGTWVDPDGTRYPGQRRIGASVGMAFYNGSSALTAPQNGTTQAFNLMRGRWRDGTLLRACGNGYNEPTCPVTTWTYSGDPVARTGWSARNTYPASATFTLATPQDLRMVLSAGPFDLQPGEGQELLFAVVWARGSGNLESVTQLRQAAAQLQGLPVELTTFAARADGRDAVLTWATASETNNAGFGVEVREGVRWREQGFVGGRGTTAERASYVYRVPHLPPGVHHFRLRQVDLDGTSHYSPEVSAEVMPAEALHLEVRGQALRLVVAETQPVRVVLLNTLGQQVATLFEGVAVAGQALPFVVPPELAHGLYLIRCTGVAAHVAAAVRR